MNARTETFDIKKLNNLLAWVTHSDPEIAGHVKCAIDFTLENAMPGGPDEDTLIASAEQLLRLHEHPLRDRFAFKLLDFRSESFDPLFIRANVRSALQLLAGTHQAVLLVTGLRRMCCPPGRNWTQKRAEQYEQTKTYIEDVAAGSIHSSMRLHLLFL